MVSILILFVARTGWNDSTLATGVTWKTAQLSFADILTDTDQFADFPRCGNKTGVTSSDYLHRQRDPSDDLYLIQDREAKVIWNPIGW